MAKYQGSTIIKSEITVSLDRDAKELFRVLCEFNGSDMRTVLINLICDYCEEHDHLLDEVDGIVAEHEEDERVYRLLRKCRDKISNLRKA